MELITCTIDVVLTAYDHTFGDGWDFNIGDYAFSKSSEDVVKVQFTYTDEVRKVGKDGVVEHGYSTWSESFVEAYERLETLLDLITYEKSGIGLKLIQDSITLASPSGSESTGSNHFSVDFHEYQSVNDRYTKTIDDNKEKLRDALRLNRLAANEENDAEKIGQVWGIIERLYASDPPKILDTKEKRLAFDTAIEELDLLDIEKTRLKNAAYGAFKASKPSMIVEQFKLIDGDGTMRSDTDMEATLKYWSSMRHKQSHGEVFMRDQYADRAAQEMTFIIETVLSSEIKPSKYVYAVYKPEDVKDYFEDSRQASIRESDGNYKIMPIHKFAANSDMPQRMKVDLKNTDSELYLIEYNMIWRITFVAVETVKLDDLQEPLKSIILECQIKLNG